MKLKRAVSVDEPRYRQQERYAWLIERMAVVVMVGVCAVLMAISWGGCWGMA